VSDGGSSTGVRAWPFATRRVPTIPQPTSPAATTVSTRPAILTASRNSAGLLRAPARCRDVAGEQHREDGAGDCDARAGGNLGDGLRERYADGGPILRQATEHVERGDNADHSHPSRHEHECDRNPYVSQVAQQTVNSARSAESLSNRERK
jgi:hypothetical protein